MVSINFSIGFSIGANKTNSPKILTIRVLNVVYLYYPAKFLSINLIVFFRSGSVSNRPLIFETAY